MRNLTLLALILSLGIAAEAKSKGKHKHAFAVTERAVIVEFYQAGGPGWKHEGLPPGIAKQYYRRGHLPPGIAKKIVPFPVVLEQRLDPCPPGLRRGFLGDAAVLYDPGRGTIIDIFIATGR